MLFAWGMGLAGERAAAPIHWFYGLLVVLGLLTAGRRWLGGAAGWLAAAMLLVTPSIVLLAGWPYVDLALLLYATLAFLSLARFCEGGPQSRRWLILSGAFAGLALSTKYTALALLPALALALLVAQTFISESRIRNLQSAIRSLLLLCGVALLVWSPWLIKNS
ncbi:MAG: phospholipid carrier-dependent glycosyltransferase, partial [Anaerolineae bacterium]|nr:phospholipid carrier-dependent glycosyltransferase [Anaerolineae bacterium]